MKVAIIGSRSLDIDISAYVPSNVTAIISGGARGIDSAAKIYARTNKLPIKEFLPDYNKYGSSAPLKRNELIIANCDIIIAIWDGKSTGTIHALNIAKKLNKPYTLYKV